jgi:hypothetical protein
VVSNNPIKVDLTDSFCLSKIGILAAVEYHLEILQTEVGFIPRVSFEMVSPVNNMRIAVNTTIMGLAGLKDSERYDNDLAKLHQALVLIHVAWALLRQDFTEPKVHTYRVSINRVESALFSVQSLLDSLGRG